MNGDSWVIRERVAFAAVVCEGKKLVALGDSMCFDSLDGTYRVINGVHLVINRVAVLREHLTADGMFSLHRAGRQPYFFYAVNAIQNDSGIFYDLAADTDPIYLDMLMSFAVDTTFIKVYLSGTRTYVR
jgi:hypothetical protein